MIYSLVNDKLFVIKKILYCRVVEIEMSRWYNISKNMKKKGEVEMDACALKPMMPFVTRNKLERTPATEDNRRMVEFMDSHNFSFAVDAKTNNIMCTVTEK